MKVMEGGGEHRHEVVLSLCDYSGNWPEPWWFEKGHTVVCLDKKHGDDLLRMTPFHVSMLLAGLVDSRSRMYVRAILAAPLCTAFTGAAALHWKRHDEDGTTAECVALANACIDIIEWFQPRTWALENPRGRIEQLVPRLAGKKRLEFNPCDFAGYLAPAALDVTADSPAEAVLASNRYTKRTCLWGEFKPLTPKRVEPIVYETATGKRGGVVWAKFGGKSERTKEIRSRTPMGFALAFQSANG